MQPLFAMIFLALRWHDVLDLINLLYLHMPFCISYFEFIEHVKTVMPTTLQGTRMDSFYEISQRKFPKMFHFDTCNIRQLYLKLLLIDSK